MLTRVYVAVCKRFNTLANDLVFVEVTLIGAAIWESELPNPWNAGIL